MTFCKHSLRLTTWLFQKSPTGFVLSKRSKTLWQTVIVSSMDPLSIEFYWVLGLRATLLLTPNRWPPLVTSRAACEAEIWRIRLRLPADTSWKRLLCFRTKENTVIYHRFCQTSNYGNCSIWCLDLTLHTPKTHIYIQSLYTIYTYCDHFTNSSQIPVHLFASPRAATTEHERSGQHRLAWCHIEANDFKWFQWSLSHPNWGHGDVTLRSCWGRKDKCT